MSRAGNAARRAVGNAILVLAPKLMKFLSVAGTAAMFLVGGSILVHGIPALAHWLEAHVPATGGWAVTMLFEAVLGIVAGAVVVAIVAGFSRLRRPRTAGP
jgi:predicted DNA repair protein MutK